MFVFWKRQRQGEHGLDLGDGEDNRQFLFLFGNLDVEQGIVIPGAPMVEPFEKAAQGGEMQPDGGAAFLLLHEVKQMTTEIIRGEAVPGAERGAFCVFLSEGDQGVAVVFDRAG